MTATLSQIYRTDKNFPESIYAQLYSIKTRRSCMGNNDAQALQNIPPAGQVFLLSPPILGGPDSDLYSSQCAAMMIAWRNDKLCAHHACSQKQELDVVRPKCAELLRRRDARSREEALWLRRGGE